ncbi:MAG: membrane protein insertase YidC, partial [Treponema sp.]|nr:membrane protein insertase YidC [Treponema sp.]
MEKNTLLAVVLSVVVLILFSVVQGIFSPPAPRPAQTQVQPAPQPPVVDNSGYGQPPAILDSGETVSGDLTDGEQEDGEEPELQYVRIETDLLSVVLSNAGGNVVSFKLKAHLDGDDLVQMIFSGDSDARAFALGFGGPDAEPEKSPLNVRQPSEHTVIFEGYVSPRNNPSQRFRLEKEYRFHPGEYMFELIVRLDGNRLQGFDFGDNAAYTLSFGPQIGPSFVKLDRYQNFRQYFSFSNGKRKNERANGSRITSRPQWAAIAGQYFTLIAIPSLPGGFDLSFSEKPEPGVPSTSRMHLIRPPLTSQRVEDVFRFYMGPMSLDVLQRFNTGDNAFDFRNMQLTEMSGTRGILAPLERLLKWLLTMFFSLIPNYGIAIILLTLLVRIAFFPLTKKSSEATLRMQAMAPKIKELQEKYRDNRQKMNVEMAELYKKEGYNPLKGCFPILLQFPIFIAMFNLFRTHFELRRAMFIPGWIPDLSVPEYI